MVNWECSRCQFVGNSETSAICELCDEPRPDMKRDIQKKPASKLETSSVDAGIDEGDLETAINFICDQKSESSKKSKKKRIPRIPRVQKIYQPMIPNREVFKKKFKKKTDRRDSLETAGSKSDHSFSVISPSPRKMPPIKDSIQHITDLTGCKRTDLIHRLLLMHRHNRNAVADQLFSHSEEELWRMIKKKDRSKREKSLRSLVKSEENKSSMAASQRAMRSVDMAAKRNRRQHSSENSSSSKRQRQSQDDDDDDDVGSTRRKGRLRAWNSKPKKKRRNTVIESDEEDEEDDDMARFVVDDDEVEEEVTLIEEQEELAPIESSDEEESEEYEDEDEFDSEKVIQEVVDTCQLHGKEIKEGIVSKEPQVNGEDISKLGPITLKEFQIYGVRWLYRLFELNLNGVLADEMGLGKTIQTIGLLRLIHKHHPEGGPSLIVAPTSVLDNWMREFGKICPSLRVAKYHGSQKDRLHLQAELIDGKRTPLFDVLVTSYSIFEKETSKFDRAWVRKRRFRFMVLDEGHNIKNQKGSRFLFLSGVGAKHRLILSGTPIQNNIQELLALLVFLMPDIFTHGQSQEVLGDIADKERSTDVFRRLLEPFCLRRVKTHVLKEMSPKKDLIFKLCLAEKQRAAYDTVVSDYKNSYKRRQTHIFTELRKAANHPLLLRQHYNDSMLSEIAGLLIHSPNMSIQCRDPHAKALDMLRKMSDFRIHMTCVEEGEHVPKLNSFLLTTERFNNVNLLKSAKFDFLKEKLPQLVAEEHRVLIFSQWTSLLDILELLMEDLALQYLRLDGSTPASERQELIDTFNGDSNFKVFLLSTKSGGVGLNLTSADTVILHDLDFNPQNDLQAENRCHRIGQKKLVTVMRLVSKDTVDEHIFAIANKKRKLNEAVLAPPAQSNKQVMSSLIKELMTSAKNKRNDDRKKNKQGGAGGGATPKTKTGSKLGDKKMSQDFKGKSARAKAEQENSPPRKQKAASSMEAEVISLLSSQ